MHFLDIFFLNVCSCDRRKFIEYLHEILSRFSLLFCFVSLKKMRMIVGGKLPADSEFPDFQDFDVVHHYLQSNGPKCQARLRKRGQKSNYTNF